MPCELGDNWLRFARVAIVREKWNAAERRGTPRNNVEHGGTFMTAVPIRAGGRARSARQSSAVGSFFQFGVHRSTLGHCCVTRYPIYSEALRA